MVKSDDIKRIKSVLFVCNQNAVRSPMAKGLADRYSKRRIFCESAGLVAGQLDGFSVAVMKEEKIDISEHQPKVLSSIPVEKFDAIIALTPESRDKVSKLAELHDIHLEYWQTPDPAEGEGNRDQVLDSYRLVRDHLECRIADFLKI
ncbi:low molecular weight phosphatase family protein [Kordiimonas sp. SCSIO 12610]|uniref:arsenate-mycothiol transferase ArsC n=1 Tax=Kordiimonas sp. SCSIO 12610 TaxID=2829597 RepID=UPI00210B0FB4|nr:low molecular weight phosphatase family protein [Kordiimonas sp. SCSIO 12610]UTW55688.1 low molecular weight phosphatase family protein [Kordiimonas sp. SCSIO 12610]